MTKEPERLDCGLIRQAMPESRRDLAIVLKQTTESTNDDAKKLGAIGAAHGTLVLSETQTRGRGRFSRGFYSPAGTGLYMSVILRPGFALSDAPLVTIASAVAVCRALKSLSGFFPAVKWVNDVYLFNKKICGILTETAMSAQSGGAAGVVTGIGINVSAKSGDFPPELRDKAGSVYPDGDPKISRSALAAYILNELLDICDEADAGRRDFLHEYKSLLFMLGRQVSYTRGGESGRGLAYDVDGRGRLLIKVSGNGDTVALDSGEVSVLI